VARKHDVTKIQFFDALDSNAMDNCVSNQGCHMARLVPHIYGTKKIGQHASNMSLISNECAIPLDSLKQRSKYA
jgi:hypothetical protein